MSSLSALAVVLPSFFFDIPATTFLSISDATDRDDTPLVETALAEGLDLADLYVFRSPEDGNRIVFALTMQLQGSGASLPAFNDNGRFQINIDTDGNDRADTQIDIEFRPFGETGERFTVGGIPSAKTFRGPVTPIGSAPVITAEGNVRAYAGVVTDPSFVDLEAVTGLLSGGCPGAGSFRCGGGGVNTFQGKSVGAFVIDLPITSLSSISDPNSGTLRVWAKSYDRE